MKFDHLYVIDVSPFVVDEWVGVAIYFRLEVQSPADVINTLNTDSASRDLLIQHVLADSRVEQYVKMAEGKTVEAGRDGSYTEIKVQKTLFIPRKPADFDEWSFCIDGGAVVGNISGSDR